MTLQPARITPGRLGHTQSSHDCHVVSPVGSNRLFVSTAASRQARREFALPAPASPPVASDRLAVRALSAPGGPKKGRGPGGPGRVVLRGPWTAWACAKHTDGVKCASDLRFYIEWPFTWGKSAGQGIVRIQMVRELHRCRSGKSNRFSSGAGQRLCRVSGRQWPVHSYAGLEAGIHYATGRTAKKSLPHKGTEKCGPFIACHGRS